MSDVQNAYLAAPCAKVIHTTFGAEFVEDEGKTAIIVRALYGLASAGASFWNHLADCMRHLGYTSCLVDPDPWYRPMVRPEDNYNYYSYILLYVDDCLCICHDAEAEIHKIDKFFTMKKGSVGDPDVYLGAKVKRMEMPNGVQAWALSSSKYVQEAIQNVENYLRDELGGWTLRKRAPTLFMSEYDPGMDMTKQLSIKLATYYQSEIGILCWMVEMGRIDIATEVSLLALHVALPLEWHLEAVFNIYAYLKHKHNSHLAPDPTYPQVHMGDFREVDWRDFYGEVREAIPDNAPKPWGKEVILRLFVDSDHANDKLWQRSRTGFSIFINMGCVIWFTKRQATIESAVFGSEFVAMKQGMEASRGLWYKLRMMGVPIAGPTSTYGDNMSVIHNTQQPESTLRKKSNSICFHAVREAVAMGELLTGHVRTTENPADLLTKVVAGGAKRNYLILLLLFDLADHD